MDLKYTYKDDKYSSHSKIINLVKPNSKVLDVGCAQGYLARELLKKKCEIIGIDNDKESLNITKRYCKKVILSDLDDFNNNLNEKFDVIIFGDILEHLKEPLLLLKKLKKNIKGSGYILVSTINIANIYVRLNLLFGRFDYTEKGILDKTHLRFFTLKTFKNLIKEAEFKIKKIDVTPIPLPILFPLTAQNRALSFIHHLNYLITILWKKMFAYQFIILAQNEKYKYK